MAIENYNYIVDHALQNVWCNPRQDLQSIIKPKKLTPLNGLKRKVELLRGTLRLPNNTDSFHVYQIGQIHPSLLGLFPHRQQWVTMESACNESNLIANIYSVNGVQLMRSLVWYYVTKEKDLIIAVKYHETWLNGVKSSPIPFNLDTEDLYVRLYSNAYFQSWRRDNNGFVDYVKVKGQYLETVQDINNFIQNEYRPYLLTRRRYMKCFVNGFLVHNLDEVPIPPGSYVEFEVDTSVRKIVTFAIDNLRTFESTLDSVRKYLLKHPEQDTNAIFIEDTPMDLRGPGNIEYIDDIDFFIVKGTIASPSGQPQERTLRVERGAFINNNTGKTLRMVTHCDYSIPTGTVAAYANSATEWPNVDGLYIRAFVRESGYVRPLVFDSNKIHELYKQPYQLELDSMTALNSAMVNWQAPVLENSPYTRLMSSECCDVTPDLVRDAYGYNGLSKVLGETPSLTRTSSGLLVADVPYLLQTNSTAYEYNQDGLLTGNFYHQLGSIYRCRDNNTKYVEFISGRATNDIEEVYGQAIVDVSDNFDYRCYTCPINPNGVISFNWVDVTNTSSYFVSNGNVNWTVDPADTYTLVKKNKKFIGYTLSLNSNLRGYLKFTLTGVQKHNGFSSNRILTTPSGELDLWLNGRSLIEGLDYVFNFPEIVITNKEYLDDPVNNNQEVTVRYTGFCKPDMTGRTEADYGFVKLGTLSKNNRFNTRDDKVLRIISHGRLYHRSELKYMEDDGTISIVDAKNGQPYQIRDIVVPLKGIVSGDVYELRDQAMVVDNKVENLLSLNMPEVIDNRVSAIDHKHTLYSPFCAALIYDLINGNLDLPVMTTVYDDVFVQTWCQYYEFLLPFDPTQDANFPTSEYTQIHPHNSDFVFGLDIHKYQFLQRAVRYYLHDRVSLSHFVVMV